ncbi:MAG: hypothetical protein CL678_18460 [Bdellovibrionaceae bacterium]|nr:hypothetical protein [Pseudobdellovibrionaceae bacterium]|tara:strand:+ start:4740 stop:4991 length:252 start_codon:yes stop_codon:yes gene_type:complete
MIREGLVTRVVDQHQIVIQPFTGEIHELNESGSLIWKELSEKNDRDHIISLLIKKFEISPETAEKDYEEFIRILKELSLIKTP